METISIAAMDEFKKILDKYKNNHTMMTKLMMFLTKIIPNTLSKYDNLTDDTKMRIINEHELGAAFISTFVNTHRYFYNTFTDIFYKYDGLYFNPVNGDAIHQHFFNAISADNTLRDLKFVLRKEGIKYIKKRSPLFSIPETTTIQNIIDLLTPDFFPTRHHAKYFLVIIGECILNRIRDISKDKELHNVNANANADVNANIIDNTSELIYLCNPSVKEIISEINSCLYKHLGSKLYFPNIKYKFNSSHTYKKCRIVTSNLNIKSSAYDVFNTIEFICVAISYANRYDNGDTFLFNCTEPTISETTLFLANNTPDSIVSLFTNSLTPCSSSSICIKNMLFIWRKFVAEHGIASIIPQEQVKLCLKQKLHFDELTDEFTGITSKHLPVVTQFISFWNTTIKCNNDENNIYDVLEIDEINILFKKFNNHASKPINDSFVVDIIRHYFPNINIINDKSISASCTLWDKRNIVLDAINNSLKKDNSRNMYDMYNEYCSSNSIERKRKHGINNTLLLNVNKTYFENVFTYAHKTDTDKVYTSM